MVPGNSEHLEGNGSAGIEKHLAAVEEARLKLVEVMNRFPDYTPATLASFKIEREVGTLTSQLDAILLLKQDRLLSGILELPISNPEYENLLKEYRSEIARKKAVEQSEGEGLENSIAAKRRQLRKMVETLKQSLHTQIMDARTRLSAAKAWEALPFGTPNATARIEYEKAKYHYEILLFGSGKAVGKF